jgi:hypothetical protein
MVDYYAYFSGALVCIPNTLHSSEFREIITKKVGDRVSEGQVIGKTSKSLYMVLYAPDDDGKDISQKNLLTLIYICKDLNRIL